MNESLNKRFLNELAIELRDFVLPEDSQVIRDQLEQHIEERRQHLLTLGLSEAEAEAAAVAAMGSPADIAKPYASINSPGRRFNIIGCVLALISALLLLLALRGYLSNVIALPFSLALAISAIYTAALGAEKGFALTLGRLLNFSGWITMLGLIGLLLDMTPSEAKVALLIEVDRPVSGVNLYRAPDTGNVLSVSKGPNDRSAYLVFSNERALVGVPPLPGHLVAPYMANLREAQANLRQDAQKQAGLKVRNSMHVFALFAAICLVACLSSVIVAGLLRRHRSPKQPLGPPPQTA